MRLVMRASSMPDWYVIERAEHDGRTWLGVIGLQCSARLSDADVEGTAEEMLEIAAAIEQERSVYFRRCAVRVDGDQAFFRSPRNSTVSGEASMAEARELATQIRRDLATPAKETP